MLQIKVSKSNVISTHASKWLAEFIKKNTDFFLQMLQAMEALSKEKTSNQLVPFMLGIINKMRTGEEITSNEVIAFSWLVRDAWETREEFTKVNGDGEDLLKKVEEIRRKNPNMTREQVLHEMMDKVKGNVFFEKSEDDTEEVKDDLEKKGFKPALDESARKLHQAMKEHLLASLTEKEWKWDRFSL